jgi:6-phosphogluconolactonase (cycloisomerase 2 family)
MPRFLSIFFSLVLVTSTAFLVAPAGAQTTPSAYVYMASNYSGSNNRVIGFSAASTGKLTEISGSPWADNVYWMAGNGKYLFASDNIANDDYRNIFRYQIESNGGLKYLGATNIQTHGSSADTCNQGAYLVLDHTGHSLYQDVSQSNCNEEQAYQAWSVNSTTGQLTYLDTTGESEYLMWPLVVAADDIWLYALGCNFAIDDMQGFKRLSNGALQAVNEQYNYPTAPPTNSYWSECFADATPDTTNHFALDVYYPNGENDHIATYAINTTNGNIHTNSTYNNTPGTQVQHVRWMNMSPSGKLLAVAGDKGVQLFNFNPSGQVTARTGLITTAPTDMVRWDNANHLYAISNSDSRLYVFNVTSSGITEAPGSPYTVAHPVTLMVQSK